MIAMPRQMANAGTEFQARAPDLGAAGLDVTIASESVRRARGDVPLFERVLSAGLDADAVAREDRQRALDLVAWAAWRSGALSLRDDALRRLDAASLDVQRAAAAAVLRVPLEHLEEFCTRQAHDRYWWPGRSDANGYVCSVGGFRGLGGAWIRPPERVARLSEAGAFAVLVAEEWWRLDSDVWGSHLTLLGADAPASLAGSDADAGADDGVRLVISDDTHLAWLHVQDR